MKLTQKQTIRRKELIKNVGSIISLFADVHAVNYGLISGTVTGAEIGTDKGLFDLSLEDLSLLYLMDISDVENQLLERA